VAAPKAPPATGAERAKWFQDCWSAFNAKDWAKFAPCYAENATSEEVESGMPAASGNKEVVRQAQMLAASAPDQTGELQLVLVNGNDIASIALVKGTNSGPIMTPNGELPATKKKFGFLLGHAADTTDDGHAVAHDRLYSDGGTFLGQLGIAKMPHRKPLEKGWAEKPVVVATGGDVEKVNLGLSAKSLEAFNKHDLPGLVGLMADDVVFSEAASPMDSTGKKAVERSYKEMFKAFSDVKLELTRSWAAGDYVVAEGSMVGTNDGAMPMAGIHKPTGKKVNVRFLEIDKIQGGKIKNIWVFDNGMAWAAQLGLLPPPAPAKSGAAPVAGAASAPGAKPGASPAAASAPTGKPAPAAAAAPAAKPAPAAAAAPAVPAAKPAAPATAAATAPAAPKTAAPAAPTAPKAAAPAAPKPATPAPAAPAPTAPTMK
jgi:steroid delta-isomerase-like uncharacterized protein